MSKSQKCKFCGKGDYSHGSALYDYYDCDHALQKPLSENSKHPPKWIHFRSPYLSSIKELPELLKLKKKDL